MSFHLVSRLGFHHLLFAGLVALLLFAPAAANAQQFPSIPPDTTYTLGSPITSFPLPPTGPIGVAATQNQLLVSLNGCQTIESISPTGVISPFATLPPPGSLATDGVCEAYLAISPGLGGFAPGVVYAVALNKIYAIPPTGGIPTLFATVPAPVQADNSHSSITFDTVGTFGNEMIVAIYNNTGTSTANCRANYTCLYTVNSAGQATFLSEINNENEGLAVMPTTSPYGAGQVLIGGGPQQHGVYAVSPSGAVTQVGDYSGANWPIDPESIRYLPAQSAQCTFGSTGLSFFQAEYNTNQIVGYKPATLSAYAGQVLVTDETFNSISILGQRSFFVGSNGLNKDTFPIQQQEGSAVVACQTTPACVIPPSGTAIGGSAVSWNQFNVPQGTSPYLWIHAHIGSPSGVPDGTVVRFTQVTFTLSTNPTPYALPDGILMFQSSHTGPPTTSFSPTTGAHGTWTTIVNPNNLSDEIFFVGSSIPVDKYISGGGQATLSYYTTSTSNTLSFPWQWSAAVFTYWPGGNAFDNSANILAYHNSDHAGTPENKQIQQSLIQGPRGGGGSNFTGSWSGTGQGTCPH